VVNSILSKAKRICVHSYQPKNPCNPCNLWQKKLLNAAKKNSVPSVTLWWIQFWAKRKEFVFIHINPKIRVIRVICGKKTFERSEKELCALCDSVVNSILSKAKRICVLSHFSTHFSLKDLVFISAFVAKTPLSKTKNRNKKNTE